MMNGVVALIGLGAIGAPIAHKLYKSYKNSFVLVASGERKRELLDGSIYINEEMFNPTVISNRSEISEEIKLLLVCVKNYSLESALKDIQNVVTDETIILPLQNGISSYEFFCDKFPNNTILHGYVQGPNTQVNGKSIYYTNPGEMHIGDSVSSVLNDVADVYSYLRMAGIGVHLEQDIQKMVWKKWMLNVAGNSVTALTNADYCDFKEKISLQRICKQAMMEFVLVAIKEGVLLDEDDIEDVINYYTNYVGRKSTSMLEDMRWHRKTENKYLAGKVIEIADKHGLEVPTIRTLYYLVDIKESLYLAHEEG